MVYIGVTGCWATAFVGVVMGRKNHREPDVESDIPGIALVSEPIPPARHRLETRAERDARLTVEAERKRERTHRRIDARVAALVDWTTCCIPGCETALNRYQIPNEVWRVTSERLPLCTYHETLIGLQVKSYMADADHLAMRERLARRYVEVEDAREQQYENFYQNGAKASQGQIYVVRQGGLIKVGWSSKLRNRLKGYGAGVQILAHYPATRSEETDLHRSLRPYLAKGREWYQDCPLLDDVVAGIIERHGEPTIFPIWTVPKRDQAARPKGFPAA